MRKRTRLRRFAAGPGSKLCMVDMMEGVDARSMAPVENLVGMVHGQFADINLDPYDPYSNNQLLYRYEWFEKEYYPNDPDLSGYFVSNGFPLQVRTDVAAPVDVVQFGDYAFALTDIDRRNTAAAIWTSPSASSWVEEPRDVVTYIPLSSLSGFTSGGHHHLVDLRTMTSIPSADWPTSGSLIDKVMSTLEFNICPQDLDEVYGDVIGGQTVVYVKSLDPHSPFFNLCYGVGAGLPSIPANFLLEIPLAPPVDFNKTGAEVFGDYDDGVGGHVSVEGTGRSVSGQEVVYGPSDGANKMHVNPMQLKNMYNYDFNTVADPGRTALTGIRRYLRVGKSQTLGWLCYKYFDSTSSPMAGYDLIERIKGLYKFRSPHLHKSNIYSVRIDNSGLNNAIRGTAEGEAFKSYLKPIIEQAILEVAVKLAPAGTQFWRVIWEGR